MWLFFHDVLCSRSFAHLALAPPGRHHIKQWSLPHNPSSFSCKTKDKSLLFLIDDQWYLCWSISWFLDSSGNLYIPRSSSTSEKSKHQCVFYSTIQPFPNGGNHVCRKLPTPYHSTNPSLYVALPDGNINGKISLCFWSIDDVAMGSSSSTMSKDLKGITQSRKKCLEGIMGW